MSGSYAEFLLSMRNQESSNNYSQHSTSYLGAYQFGEQALVDIGWLNADSDITDNNYGGGFTAAAPANNISEFLASPSAQDQAAALWWQRIWELVRNYDLEFYDQQTLNNVTLTKSG